MKVLLVPDRPGWAFDHRAKDLLSLNFKNITFRLKYANDVTSKDQRRYNIIYPMSLSIARTLNQKGIPLNKMASAITSIRVFNHYFKNQTFHPEFINFVMQLRGINTWSNEITTIFKKQCPIYKTRIGIDENLFKPLKKKRKNRTFTIGWVGNIKKKEYRELKGYDLVLKAIEGLDVKLTIRTFGKRVVPREQMVPFYQSLDCFICSSQSEGLPNPVLEAASCGVPIITTKVGVVPELIRHKYNGIIIPRTVEAIRKEIKTLMRHPEKGQRMGRRIRRSIVENWTWDKCKRDWETYFLDIGK